MYTHTKFDHEFADSPPAKTSFVVCSTPRCGSSLLCESLCLTGMAGAPTEYFDEETKQGFLRHWQSPNDTNYLHTLIRKKTTPNGVFGFKSHWPQYRTAFGQDVILASLPNLKFIFIRRRNRVRQAVSYWRAIQTNQWAVTHRSTNESPRYDFAEIDKLLRRIQREEKSWLDFFSTHNVIPLELIYEDFSASVRTAVQSCFEHLGLTLPNEWTLPELTLKKQADHVSDQWVARFLHEREGGH